ncbi:hypothetical protein ACUXIL_004052 [Ralstonia pickettii]
MKIAQILLPSFPDEKFEEFSRFEVGTRRLANMA